MKKKSLRTLQQLADAGLIRESTVSSLLPVTDRFSFALTEQMADKIDASNPMDPIGLQFIPQEKELSITQMERTDPIGDERHMPVKGIVHRYPDRCLFMPVQVCPVYCRFCFRREKVSDGHQTLDPAALQCAYDYLVAHPEIWEVILSGGDPLILKPRALSSIVSALDAIPHIEVLRIHTRVPVVASDKITDELITLLRGSKKTVYVILHINHPGEWSEAAQLACAKLIDAGIPLLSQTVLLRNVNHHVDILSSLMRLLVKNRIKPYYLHHGDLAQGTGHFRTSIAEGQALMRALRGRFSGLCQPTYVVDIPGGYGKVPMGPHYWQAKSEEGYEIEDYLGVCHTYTEENI